VKGVARKGVGRFYEFGLFRLDPIRRRLSCDGKFIQLYPKAVEALIILVEHSGEILEREALMSALWPDTIVEESNLTVAISHLRRVLGKNGNGLAEFIQTIPRVGYRFVAEVRTDEEQAVPLRSASRDRPQPNIVVDHGNGAVFESKELIPDRARELVVSAKRQRIRWPRVALAAASLLVLAVIGWLLFSARSPKLPGGTAQVKTMAVLPFKMLNTDPTDEYLGVGLADALITQIGRIRQILVRPTGAVQKYAESHTQDPLTAGRELRVEAVLDGTVQREADNLRVTVRLLRVGDGAVLWSGKFDEKFRDVFTVQESIAQEVARALIWNLSAEDTKLLTKRHTDNVDAYRLYLKGRYFWNKRTPAGLQQSLAYFRQAIDLDPTYALAYSGLADCYAVLGWYGNHPFDETFPKAKALAEKALEIDSGLAEPHATLALALHSYYSAWARAENEYKRALELNPNYATAHDWYGWYLIEVGRRDESVQEMKRALELDPVSLQINADLGAVLLDAYRLDEAIKYLKAALEMDQDFTEAHFTLGRAYLQKGDFERSITEYEKARELSHDRPDVLSELGNAYALAGKTAKAMSILSQLNEMPKQNNVSPYHLAIVFVGLGEKEKALAALEAAASQGHSGFLVGLKAEPTFDPLRNEPRFQKVLMSIGLTP
jgi:DNA-binding winged helix-turn-helix (wHTH) protein/TolB-like protein/Tfp pilus assembly protein PilF